MEKLHTWRMERLHTLTWHIERLHTHMLVFYMLPDHLCTSLAMKKIEQKIVQTSY